MSRKTSKRFQSVLAILVLCLILPLAHPAVSDPGSVRLYAVLDSPDLFASVGSSPDPGAGVVVTFEALDPVTGATLAQAVATADGGLANASLDLNDGSYKIRAVAEGFTDSWYTALSGRDGGAFDELLTLQDGDTFDSADVIEVDSVIPDNSSWNGEGWTVIHPSASSISGGAASDSTAEQGTLLDGVAVDLFDATAPESGPVSTTTTTNGYYTFQDQAPGSYKVRFTHENTTRWWPETEHWGEAEVITLDGASHFNLAYAVFRQTDQTADRQVVLSGEPALGSTITATPDRTDESAFGVDCFQRYTWLLDGEPVPEAFGPTFTIPVDAGGKSVSVQLDTAGFGCAYTTTMSGPVGPVDPSLTLAGEDVVVAPVDNTGAVPATLNFENVLESGTTTVTRLDAADAPPLGAFSSLTDPPIIYDIDTTAVFSEALGVTVCITFDTSGMTAEQAAGQHLYHYRDGLWEDITVSSSTGVVCGLTHSFSPFAVGQPHWPFRGFLEPVNNDGVTNVAKAGSAVPIKFSVGGDRGPAILAEGSPSSSAVACTANNVQDLVEQTVTAGSGSLAYDPGTDTYTYVWKTQKAWAGTCRQFTLELNDGSSHTALFDFRR